jgi:hypothetical protein
MCHPSANQSGGFRMKKQVCRVLLLLGVFVSLAGVLINTGCEEAEGTHSLTVEPSFMDLTVSSGNSTTTNGVTTNGVYTLTFTVTEDSLRDLSLPLEWTVSEPLLGSIRYVGGNSAAYLPNKNQHGDNAIFVEDQYGARGTATVRQ